MRGFIQLSREFFKTKEWRESRSLSDAEAMLYMISKAGIEAKTELVKGKTIHLQAGELKASERFLAEEWNWNRNKIARFLDRIEQVGHISRRVEKGEGIIRIKRFIISLESVNGSEIESAKQGYNPLDISDLTYSYDSEVSQQMSQQTSQARVSHEPPINNKEDNENNVNNKKEKPPFPPFSEKPGPDISVQSPKQEASDLNTEKKEKEKSCGKKEKEALGVLRPCEASNEAMQCHHPTEERNAIREASNMLKMDFREEDPTDHERRDVKIGPAQEIQRQNARKELSYPFESERFKQAWALWKQYKRDSHGFKYKGTTYEQIGLNQLKKKAAGHEATAIGIIEQSIANGWEGLFELKDPKAQEPRGASHVQLPRRPFDKNR